MGEPTPGPRQTASVGTRPGHLLEPFHAAPKTWALIGCLLLALATAIIYSQVTSHPFLYYDDQDYVMNNTHVQHGLDWTSVEWAFSKFANGNWHPLTWFSHMLDYKVFGM